MLIFFKAVRGRMMYYLGVLATLIIFFVIFNGELLTRSENGYLHALLNAVGLQEMLSLEFILIPITLVLIQLRKHQIQWLVRQKNRTRVLTGEYQCDGLDAAVVLGLATLIYGGVPTIIYANSLFMTASLTVVINRWLFMMIAITIYRISARFLNRWLAIAGGMAPSFVAFIFSATKLKFLQYLDPFNGDFGIKGQVALGMGLLGVTCVITIIRYLVCVNQDYS